MKRWMCLAMALAGPALLLGPGARPAAPDTARFDERFLPADRTGCTRRSPLFVAVRALNTPFLGETLNVEVTARNGPVPGNYRWRVFGMKGGLDFGEVVPDWTAPFAAHETKVMNLACRVTTTEPFFIVGIMESSSDSERPAIPAQGVARLFPFDASGGGIVAHWDPSTQRPLPRPGVTDPYVELPGGQKAHVRRFGVEPSSILKREDF